MNYWHDSETNKQQKKERKRKGEKKNLVIILTLTLFGCWKVPASRGPRGSQSLMLESQAPVITTFTSGQNSTHLQKRRPLKKGLYIYTHFFFFPTKC